MDQQQEGDANLKEIEEQYSKGFVFVNKALSLDEKGEKERARDYYRKGLNHLVRGVSIPSQGSACVGPQWESAREMQQKMRETTKNVKSRLSILGENAQPCTSAGSPSPEASKLYPAIPSKEKPEMPSVPNSLVSPPQSLVVGRSAESTSQGPLPVISPSSLPNEAPPVYTPEATDGHFTVSYGTNTGEFSVVGDDYYTKCTQPPPVQSFGVDADELILIPHGVQIFYVTPDGQVSAPSYPGYLRIVKFLDTDAATAQNHPPAFLQVCDWVYPLMHNQSPVLSCNNGIYMFPDMMSGVSGSYVGVVLSSELPAADRELFEDLLNQMSDLRVQVPGSYEGERPRSYKELFEDLLKLKPDLIAKPVEVTGDVINLSHIVPVQPMPEESERELPVWSEKIAHGILSGASWVSWGLVKGAEYTGKAIHKGASKLREHIQPEEKPLEVNPTVAKGLHIAKKASGGAVKVSQFLVEGVCSIASCVGKELAPHVKKHGSKLVPESMKKDKDGKSNLDGALVVAASGVQGFSTIWNGLESAAKCIAHSVSKETVQTVKYKYKNRKNGDEPSVVTKSEKQ